MLEINIPGFYSLHLEHLVLDYNGTMAYNGYLLSGVKDHLNALGQHLKIHVLTADTFGKVKTELNGLGCELHILSLESQDIGKLNYINQLGPEITVCIGNGRNDRLMLQKAALGIAIMQGEGVATDAVNAADIVVHDIIIALQLLNNPLQLIATLRS